jgi:predicted nucleotidyltransferase
MDGAEHDRVARLASAEQGLRLLLLFGSRARGDSIERSDWDFGYIATPDFDPARFVGLLVGLLGTEAVDVVDLERAGGLVRFRAARDGVVLFEATPGVFERFWFVAVSFWCDMGPIIRAGYEDVLAGLER